MVFMDDVVKLLRCAPSTIKRQLRMRVSRAAAAGKSTSGTRGGRRRSQVDRRERIGRALAAVSRTCPSPGLSADRSSTATRLAAGEFNRRGPYDVAAAAGWVGRAPRLPMPRRFDPGRITSMGVGVSWGT